MVHPVDSPPGLDFILKEDRFLKRVESEMMKFKISKEIFEIQPDLCFGVVVARGVESREVSTGLEEAAKELEGKYSGCKAKELEEIVPYREAFKRMGYNPNKFMPSIESLASRVLKGKGIPSILPVVDLYNSISLKYLLPIGGHDMDSGEGDIEVRLSMAGDLFTPFGSPEAEELPLGEVVYSVGNRVKTRRWIWRQGELGKIEEQSRNIFFPIDGFEGKNDLEVREAAQELAHKLKTLLQCEVKTGYINRENMEIEL